MTALSRRIAAAAALAPVWLAEGAAAQDRGFLNWTPGTFAVTEGRVGLGVGWAPDYLGSDEMMAIPLPSFAFTVGNIPVQNNLLGIEIDIRPGFAAPERGKALLAYGPILRYDNGRNDGLLVADPQVSQTAPVEATPEVGIFVEGTLPLFGLGAGPAPTLLTARVAVVQATQSYDGATADLSIGAVRPGEHWTFGGGFGMSWADDRTAQAFFDVTPADSGASGLPTYQAAGGLLTLGASLFASYALTDRWSVNGIAGYTLVTGSAADSPIVAIAGQAQQPFLGLGLNLSF